MQLKLPLYLFFGISFFSSTFPTVLPRVHVILQGLKLLSQLRALNPLFTYQGTTNKTFALNVGGGWLTGGGSGITVQEGSQQIAGLTLHPSRRGWVITIPADSDLSNLANLFTTEENVFLGSQAGNTLLTWANPRLFAARNVGVGSCSLKSLVNTGNNSYNIAIGFLSGANLQGGSNIALGAGSLMGFSNPQQFFFGSSTSVHNGPVIGGNNNIGIGLFTLARLTGTSTTLKNNQNIGIGMYAGYGLNAGNNNIAIGTGTLTSPFSNNMASSQMSFPTFSNVILNQPNYQCSYNIAIGFQALQRTLGDQFGGYGNIALGVQAGANIAGNTNNAIFIGSPGPNKAQTGTYIANIYGHALDPKISRGSPQTIFVNSVDELGIPKITSDSVTILETHKGNVTPSPGAQFETIVKTELYNLPVSLFRYPDDTKNTYRYGIAADKIVDDSDILHLSSLLIYDKSTGENIAVEMHSLIPLLIVGYQILQRDFNQLKSDFDTYVATHP